MFFIVYLLQQCRHPQMPTLATLSMLRPWWLEGHGPLSKRNWVGHRKAARHQATVGLILPGPLTQEGGFRASVQEYFISQWCGKDVHKEREVEVIPQGWVKVCEQRVLFTVLLVHHGRSLLLCKAKHHLANEDFNDHIINELWLSVGGFTCLLAMVSRTWTVDSWNCFTMTLQLTY